MLTARTLTGVETFSPGKVVKVCPSIGVLFHVQLDTDASTEYPITEGRQIKISPVVTSVDLPAQTAVETPPLLSDQLEMEVDGVDAEVDAKRKRESEEPPQNPPAQPRKKMTRLGRVIKPSAWNDHSS